MIGNLRYAASLFPVRLCPIYVSGACCEAVIRVSLAKFWIMDKSWVIGRTKFDMVMAKRSKNKIYEEPIVDVLVNAMQVVLVDLPSTAEVLNLHVLHFQEVEAVHISVVVSSISDSQGHSAGGLAMG